jgi:N-succinyl-L-ornithine transcarbamylase
VEIMHQNPGFDFSITHPRGYELCPEITRDTPIIYDQKEALKNADFVYVKNWSSYEPYGKVLNKDPKWMITREKIGDANFMHCLPVRRNVVVEDAVLDGDHSLVLEQANNRTFAAQVALLKILEAL